MTKKELEVLREVVRRGGELSPVDVINGIAQGDEKSVKNLVVRGYLATNDHQRADLNGNYYNIPFYFATEKGIVRFLPLYTRAWFEIRTNLATYVSIIGVFVSIAALFSTVTFAALQNDRENKDFSIKNRPYVVISSVDSNTKDTITSYNLHIKNVGVLPAKMKRMELSCSDNNQVGQIVSKTNSNIVGNGEETISSFSITNSPKLVCNILMGYASALNVTDNDYETTYSLQLEQGKVPQPLDARMN